MAIVTLKELILLDKRSSSPLGNSQSSELSAQQQQFQLLVKQKRRGLNVEPLLNEQHLIWLEQLESFIPGIFDPRKKIYLDTRWQAQLQFELASHWLSVPINAGVVKNKVRLYEWRIGSADLIWSDRVKLWVACQYLQYQPEDLIMVICAFSPEHNGYIAKTCARSLDYYTIEEKLKSLLTKDRDRAFSNPTKYHDYVFNIDEIEEVEL